MGKKIKTIARKRKDKEKLLFKGIFQRKLRWVEIGYNGTGLALVLGHWAFFFNFKGSPSWILQKNVLSPLEPKLLVRWKKSVKR
jgi:hypothetical protein